MFTSSRKHKKLPIPFRPRLEILEDRSLLSVCTVDRLTDLGEGKGLSGDLRYCITRAADGDEITFGVTGTINLAGVLPDLTRSINIEGPGADQLTVRRNTGGNYRIFTVATDVTAGISALTIANGSGGILNNGTLTIARCTFSASGVSNVGTLTVSASTFSGNGIQNSGMESIADSTFAPGAISNSGTLTLANSRVSGNYTTGIGAGINNSGTLDITASTISGNTAISSGGGIFNGGRLTITNSTISGNTSKVRTGGGIFNHNALTINNSTISNNSAGGAGGIDNQGALTMWNTILAGNSRGDLSGSLTSGDHDLIGGNPLLGPLQDNGGPTQTMALLPGSPAVDAGDNTNAPQFDQRGKGFDRIVGGNIDIGAFEAQIGSATSFRLDAPNSVLSGMQFNITVTALDDYSHVDTGYTGTVTFTTTDTGKGVVLPADYTFTADEGGVHKFTDTGRGETTLITSGDQTISATDTKDDSITGDATVTIVGGDVPRMGGRKLSAGHFNWLGSVFGFPIHRKGSVNSENLF
jgi:hypothetical protein